MLRRNITIVGLILTLLTAGACSMGNGDKLVTAFSNRTAASIDQAAKAVDSPDGGLINARANLEQSIADGKKNLADQIFQYNQHTEALNKQQADYAKYLKAAQKAKELNKPDLLDAAIKRAVQAKRLIDAEQITVELLQKSIDKQKTAITDMINKIDNVNAAQGQLEAAHAIESAQKSIEVVSGVAVDSQIQSALDAADAAVGKVDAQIQANEELAKGASIDQQLDALVSEITGTVSAVMSGTVSITDTVNALSKQK